MTAISADEATRTRLCKSFDCDGIAQDRRGRYAGLCGVCKEGKKLERTRTARVTPSANGAESFEQRAKRLVPAGRAIDRARKRYVTAQAGLEPIKDELRQAMDEWKRLLRELAGGTEE